MAESQQIKIKAVFFDAADTLFRVRGSVGEVYSRIARKYGAEVTAEEMNREFHKAFNSFPRMVFPGANSTEIKKLEKKWWYNLVYNVFKDIEIFSRFDEFFDELFEVFGGKKAWELFPETKDILKFLKSRDLTLGIVSNFDSRVYDLLTELEVLDYFDLIVISSQVGFAKPSPEIFQIALERGRLFPKEAIHVGDSLEEDLQGANAAGINPVLLDRKGRYCGLTNFRRISNLSELNSLAFL